MFLRGLLKSRSKDINLLQKFVDTIILTFLFQILTGNGIEIYNIFFLSSIIINFAVLNYFKIYDSYREKNLNIIFFKILFISFSFTFLNLLFNSRLDFLPNNEILLLLLFTNLYLFFHHIFLRCFLRYLRKYGFNSRNVIFFGSRDSYIYMLKELTRYPWLGYRIKYWYSPNKIDFKKEDPINLVNQDCMGGFQEMKEKVFSEDLDKLFFCHSDSDDFSLDEVFKILGDLCIPVSYVVDWNKKYMTLEREYIGDIMALNIWNPSNLIINKKIKRIFDFYFSLIIIFIIFPFLLLISVLIKISSHGPILYTQDRYGFNGRLFKMYKFRTMYHERNSLNKKFEQAKINDKRVTKIGKYLRKYSLDELPQLFNVIRGEMSLVGPRPHAVEQNEFYRKKITGYMQRHSRLPGMTGLAQIRGARGETKDIEKMNLRINYDLEYNNNWNLFKDFHILLKTIFCILKGDAY